jgi:hypothetical protein
MKGSCQRKGLAVLPAFLNSYGAAGENDIRSTRQLMLYVEKRNANFWNQK